ERNQFCRVFANIDGVAQAVAIIDPHVAAIDPAQLFQALHERRIPFLGIGIGFEGTAREHADPPHAFGLLRARRERPGCDRTAEKRYELAPPHHSITSSARSRNDSGIWRPSALAVVRLTMRS